MPSETWRVVLASGEVREVVVTQRGDGQWVAVLSGGTRKRHGFSASSAVWTACPAGAREILAPNDPTRAELAAQLAAVTAERDVDLEECSTLRRGLDHADSVIDEIREVLGAADDEGAVVAAERVTAERDALRAERDGLRDRLTDEQIAAAEARRRVLAHDRLRQMAEGQRDALRAEHAADCDLIVRQGSILAAVADALKGPPPALSSHSHHDLGAVAAATVAQQAPLVACVDALRAAATSAGWRDADATGETLVAWVRRGALLDAARIALERGGERVAKAIVARANEEGGE